MRRSPSRFWAGLACLALVAPGCGGDLFGPPSRPRSAPPAVEPRPVFLVYVVPGVPTGDLETWGLRAQHEANGHRAIFRIMGPGPGESSGGQPAIVRRAVAGGASALLVYPGDSPELPGALAEAEAKGVPVVLIDKPVAAPEGSKPFTSVEPAPIDRPARQLVAAMVEDLKKAGRPPDGTAIVLVDKLTDRTSGPRAAALKSAAASANFRQVVEVPFDGSTEEAARLAVLEAVKANPDVSIVLAEDAEGFAGAALARSGLRGKPAFFVGGCVDYRTSRVAFPPARESGYIEGRFTELGGLAVFTALARLRGESVGEHVYQTPRFARTEAAVATEADAQVAAPAPKIAESESRVKDASPRPEPPKATKPQ